MAYELTPIKLGCEVRGIKLRDPIPEDVKNKIIEDVREHRILVFKDQGVLPPERHLELGKWFGQIESTFYDHPKSPHRDIFRVSNDRSEGCTNVGRTGWHIDGSFQDAPFSHALYHIISCPTEGATVFVGLTELIEQLDSAKRSRWEKLWMISDRRGGPVHPLVYSHPETKKQVLCFHLGMIDTFAENYGTAECRVLDPEETEAVLADIHHEIVKDDGAIQYKHKWEPGDFIMSDNLAVGHEASPETQKHRDKVGLRVMHRVTIAGKEKPKK